MSFWGFGGTADPSLRSGSRRSGNGFFCSPPKLGLGGPPPVRLAFGSLRAGYGALVNFQAVVDSIFLDELLIAGEFSG